MSGFVDRPGRAFPEIRFGDQSDQSCYDGPTHKAKDVIDKAGGVELARSNVMPGEYLTRHVVERDISGTTPEVGQWVELGRFGTDAEARVAFRAWVADGGDGR